MMSASFRISRIESIYAQNYDEYVNIARAIIKSSDQAADAVQNVFEYLLSNHEKLIGVKNYEAYIKVCVKNEAIDIYRKNRRSVSTDPFTISVTDEQSPKARRIFELRQLLLKELEQYPEHISNAYADHVLCDMPIKLLAKNLGMKQDTLAHYFGRIKKFLIKNSSTIIPLILAIFLYLCFLFFTR